MQPDEADDINGEVRDPTGPGSGPEPRSSAIEDDVDAVGLDGGGDPVCWLGLIDDQRDHQ